MIKVQAHTGSTKNHSYKLVTGVLVGFREQAIPGTRFNKIVAVIDGDDGTRYVTGRARIVSQWDAPEPVTEDAETFDIPVDGEIVTLDRPTTEAIMADWLVIKHLLRDHEEFEARRKITALRAEFGMFPVSYFKTIGRWAEHNLLSH